MSAPTREWVDSLPKAELHLHIEGTLEPELMFELGERNGVELAYASVEAAHAAYEFEDLQSFLDLYYAGCAVLRTAEDFADLTRAYVARAAAQGVRHTEIFFDPQTHTDRGVDFDTVLDGIAAGLDDGERDHGVTSRMIMCFLRDQSAESASATLDALLAAPAAARVVGVGLDSAEVGNPPSKFRSVFERAIAEGLRTVAHAGEEGDPEYIVEALDLLQVSRIDHGVRCTEDDAVVARLVDEAIPLTVCPLSNVKLRVFDTLADHNLADMLRSGIRVTINSDDPAYFGGYVGDNYFETAHALDLSADDLRTIAVHSFEASWLPTADIARHVATVHAH